MLATHCSLETILEQVCRFLRGSSRCLIEPAFFDYQSMCSPPPAPRHNPHRTDSGVRSERSIQESYSRLSYLLARGCKVAGVEYDRGEGERRAHQRHRSVRFNVDLERRTAAHLHFNLAQGHRCRRDVRRRDAGDSASGPDAWQPPSVHNCPSDASVIRLLCWFDRHHGELQTNGRWITLESTHRFT